MLKKAYVNGDNEKLNVAYDALKPNTEDKLNLEVGVLYKAVKSVEDDGVTYITKVQEATAKTAGDPVAVGDASFQIKSETTANVEKFTAKDTTFVLVTYQPKDMSAYNKAVKDGVKYTGKWEYVVSNGSINDMKEDDENIAVSVAVIEKDDQNAELVYIYHTYKNDGKDPDPEKPNTGVVTLTLTGKLADATVWSKDGKTEYTGTETKEFGKVVSKSFQIPENTTVTIVDEKDIAAADHKMDVALTTEDVTLGDTDLGIENGTIVTIKVDGVVVKTVAKDSAPEAIKGLAKGKYLFDTKVSATAYPETEPVDTDKDRNLYTAYQILVQGGASVATMTLNDEAKTKVSSENYVAKGETVILTFNKAGTYKINDEVVTVKAKETKEVTVDSKIKVLAWETQADFEKNVADAVKAVGFDKNGVKNATGAKLTLAGNKLTVEITADIFSNPENVKGTNLMVLVAALQAKGYDVTLVDNGVKYDVTGGMTKADLIDLLPGNHGTKDFEVIVSSDKVDKPVNFEVTVSVKF